MLHPYHALKAISLGSLRPIYKNMYAYRHLLSHRSKMVGHEGLQIGKAVESHEYN